MINTPANTAVVGDLNLCFIVDLGVPFIFLAVRQSINSLKNYVKRLAKGFLSCSPFLENHQTSA
jgi:hypothetical protein